MERHALSVTAENHPGVLTQVCGLFAKRQFNIQHLVAGPTDQMGLSHMTIVVRNNTDAGVEDVMRLIEDVPHVTAVEEIENIDAVVDELQGANERAPRTVHSLTQRAF